MTDAQDITPVAPPPAFRATDTSAQALDAVGLRAMAGQRRKIFDIVVAAQRRGGRLPAAASAASDFRKVSRRMLSPCL